MGNIYDTLDYLDRKLNSYENAVLNLPLILEILHMCGEHEVADILMSSFNRIETQISKDEKYYIDLTQEVRN